MHRRLIGKRASLSCWLIQVIFNRSLYIIRFPLIYYAYIQDQPNIKVLSTQNLVYCGIAWEPIHPMVSVVCIKEIWYFEYLFYMKVMDFIFQNFLFCLSIIEATLYIVEAASLIQICSFEACFVTLNINNV